MTMRAGGTEGYFFAGAAGAAGAAGVGAASAGAGVVERRSGVNSTAGAAGAAASPPRPYFRNLVLDCDGVLVDSEPVANRVVAEELSALGWAMTAHEADGHFLGLTFTDMQPLIERRLGRALRLAAAARAACPARLLRAG